MAVPGRNCARIWKPPQAVGAPAQKNLLTEASPTKVLPLLGGRLPLCRRSFAMNPAASSRRSPKSAIWSPASAFFQGNPALTKHRTRKRRSPPTQERQSNMLRAIVTFIALTSVLAFLGREAAAAATLAINLTADGVTHAYTPGFTVYFPRAGLPPSAIYFSPSSIDTVDFNLPAGVGGGLDGIDHLQISFLSPAGSGFSVTSSPFLLGLSCTVRILTSNPAIMPGMASASLLNSSVEDLVIFAGAAASQRNPKYWDLHCGIRESLINPLSFSGLVIGVDLPVGDDGTIVSIQSVSLAVSADIPDDASDPGQFLFLVPEPGTTSCFLIPATTLLLLRRKRTGNHETAPNTVCPSLAATLRISR